MPIDINLIKRFIFVSVGVRALQDRAGYWWLKATGKIEVDCEEVSEILGRKFSVYDFLVDVSSTIGRAFTLGEKFTITSELMGLDRQLEDLKS